MSAPQNPIPPAEPPATSQTAPETPAGAPTAAPPASPAPPSAPAPAPATPAAKPSASSTLGNILANVASVLVGIMPTIPVGVISTGATVAESALRVVAEWLATRGSDNALTEQQAEAALQQLMEGLATLAAPLPTPETLESEGLPASTAAPTPVPST